MDDCLFCKIAKHEISADFVYEDDKLFAIKDIMPQAPVHILIIPKKHIQDILDLKKIELNLFDKIFLIATKIASDYNLKEKGFRLVNNTGPDGGQTVSHLHFHFLGGRAMHWPPG